MFEHKSGNQRSKGPADQLHGTILIPSSHESLPHADSYTTIGLIFLVLLARQSPLFRPPKIWRYLLISKKILVRTAFSHFKEIVE